MLKGLFKPKWQSKNPSVRLKALKQLTGSSDELIQIAQQDPDTTVRLEAIKNLHHLPTLVSIISSADKATVALAKKRFSELALSHRVDEFVLARHYALIDDANIHPKIVMDSKKSIDVRKQALSQINDQDQLFTIASSNPSKEIQFLAASQLNDYQKIKKLEKSTNNNKKLRQLLKDRARIYQEKEDQLTLLNRLCDEIQTLGDIDERWNQDRTRFLTIQQQWKNTATELTSGLQARYETAVAAYEQKLVQKQLADEKLQPLRKTFNAIIQTFNNLATTLKQEAESVSQTEVDEIIIAAEQSWDMLKSQLPANEATLMEQAYSAAHAQIKTKQIEFNAIKGSLKQFQRLQDKADKLCKGKRAIQEKDIVALQQQWQALPAPIGVDKKTLSFAFDKTVNALRAKRKKQIEQNQAQLAKILHTLDQMEAEITQDQLGKAIKTYHAANTLIRSTSDIPKQQLAQAKQRISAATPLVKSAQDWRHWGTDKAREQLIEQAKSLCEDTNIKPTARAEKIKSLRKNWKQLGKMDPTQHQKLWETFDATCSKAYEPCQHYFDEQAATRKDNLQQRQNICEQLQKLEQSTDWKSVDWKEINRKINQLRNKWKKLGTVDRSQWKGINEVFNTAMDALEVHLSNERRVNWAKRENLVKQAESLTVELEKNSGDEALLATLIEQAKSLQSQWQPTVSSHRSDEQKLWNAFRTALDLIFNTQRDKQSANREALKKNLINKQSLLAEAEQLATSQGDDLLTAESKIKQLEEKFNAINALPNKQQLKTYEAKFSLIKKQIKESVEQYQYTKKIEQLRLLVKKAKLCAEHEAGNDVQASWEATDQLLDKKLEADIQQRFTHATDDSSEANYTQQLALILDIEILLELPTPEEYQQNRMERQVERLSGQMLSSSQSAQSNTDIALEKLKTWCLLPSSQSELQVSLNKRFSHIENWLEAQKSR